MRIVGVTCVPRNHNYDSGQKKIPKWATKKPSFSNLGEITVLP
jgi:hypothetical protein